jgi:Kdo2-lipid IVA lauroyltransferase/acyltransferase
MARSDPTDPDDAPTGTRAEWWQDRALRGVIGGLNRLPYARRMALMGALTARVIGPLAGYHRRARAQLALIYPDMPAATCHALATRVCDNFGRTLLENYANRDFAARLSDVQPTGDGLAPLAQARAEGRPVIFVTGHFGNFEAPRHVLTRDGAVIGGLYRPMANAYVDSHYRETMTRWGGPVFPQGSRGTMGFARHIKGGGMGTLLFDVHVFRAPAIEMALRFDALLIPYFGTRRPDGLSFDVAVEAPIPHTDPLTMMTEASQRLAARIAVHPEQWFWVHRRWR